MNMACRALSSSRETVEKPYGIQTEKPSDVPTPTIYGSWCMRGNTPRSQRGDGGFNSRRADGRTT